MVLVVEDDKSIRETLCYFLSSKGLLFDCTGSLKDAMKKLEVLKPDILLTDMLFGAMDAAELIKRCIKLHPKAKIVVMTAMPPGLAQEAVRRTGAHLLVQKPFTLEALEAALDH